MILRVQSVAFIDDFSISVVVSGVDEVLSPVNHTNIDEMVCVPAELAKLQCAGLFQSIGKRLPTSAA
jgi:hypothetical protein